MSLVQQRLNNIGDTLTVAIPENSTVVIGIQNDPDDAGDTDVFEATINGTDWFLVALAAFLGPTGNNTAGVAWAGSSTTNSAAFIAFRVRRTALGVQPQRTTIAIRLNVIATPFAPPMGR